MEDISRELEREIARIKPKPFDRPKGKNILIVNDFGEMRSGNYLKGGIYFFLVVSLFAGLGTAGFYWLYSQAHSQNVTLNASVEALEKKVQRLTSEKELLMARLVVTGNASELETLTAKAEPALPQKEKRQGMKDKKNPDTAPDTPAPDKTPDKKPETKVPSDQPAEVLPEDQVAQASEEDRVASEQPPEHAASVTVEDFSLSRGNSDHEIVIQFSLKNTTQNSREISGRLFCVLRPENGDPSQWVITPKASMKNGVPGPYRKGHYFSISRFKPVQFTVSTKIPPEEFTSTSIYIFDEAETLLSETTFKSGITEGD